MQPVDMETIGLVDWSGFTDYGKVEVYAPRDEGEISSLVRHCRASRKKLRVVGLRTSWSALWYCKDVMISAKNLDRIEIDVQGRTVTCGAGTTLTRLHQALWEKGLTLETAPGVDWVTVGGAISTASHGSGHASISSSMIGCRLVTADGEVVAIGEGDERLDAVRVSMGMLGVLATVTLRVVPAFHVRARRSRIPTGDWKRFLTEGEMSYAHWFPHTEHSILVRVDVLSDPREAQRIVASTARTEADPLSDPQGIRGTEGAVFSPDKYRRAVAELANLVPSTFPARNRYLLDVYYPDSDRVGPAHEMLMSYRTQPIAGSEWAVPVARFDAVLSDLQAEIAKGDFYLPIVWLKKVKAETAWLRAADEDCVQCGMYHDVIAGTPSHVKEMVTRVEPIMIKHGGRPHLGKLIYMPPSDLKRLYPHWEKFDNLRQQMDPEGMFWSEAIEARFGPPRARQ
jgi:FAD/FMN-containing dehydrogenase